MGIAAAIGIGAGIDAFGRVKAGQKAKQIGEINARNIEDIGELNARLVEEGTEQNALIAEFNAAIFEAKARDAIRRGKEDETRFRGGIRGFIGSQKVAFAAQGVDIGSGSALDVQVDTAYQGELDAQAIRVNAGREAWGYNAEAEDARMQARATRKTGKLQAQSVRSTSRAEALSSRLNGKAAASAGTYGAASSIVGATTNILYNKYGFRD